MVERLKTSILLDLLKIIILCLAGIILALTFNWFHPMRLPILPGEVKRPGVPEFIWRQVTYVQPREAWDRITAGEGLLVDAQNRQDYESKHAVSAVSLPYYGYDDFVASFEERVSKDTPLYIYCYGSSCQLSIRVAKRLVLLGYRNMHVVQGGIERWVEAGLPVETGVDEVQKDGKEARDGF